MPLDKIAQRYADQLFAKKLEECAREHQQRIRGINQDFGARGMTSSGSYMAAVTAAGLQHAEAAAQARVDALLSAYGKAGLPFDRAAIEEVIKELTQICEVRKGSLLDDMALTARRTGVELPSLEGELRGEIDRGISGILARIRRDLSIRLDESTLKAREGTRRAATEEAEWDVFIAHASEDKEGFVRPLASALSTRLRVWYDDFTLKVGDSLRESIDRGLAQSRYGVVVLSPNFFAKNWPRQELDGLIAKETGHEKVVLPVWHNVSREDVLVFSPMLAGRVAARSAEGLDEVVRKLLQAVGCVN